MAGTVASSIVVAALATANPPPAVSQDDILAAFYGNTLVTVDDGIKAYFYYKPDHTFTGKVPEFYFALKGTWNVDQKGEVCRVFDPLPPRMTNPDCGPMLVHRVGDAGSDASGHKERLLAGMR